MIEVVTIARNGPGRPETIDLGFGRRRVARTGKERAR